MIVDWYEENGYFFGRLFTSMPRRTWLLPLFDLIGYPAAHSCRHSFEIRSCFVDGQRKKAVFGFLPVSFCRRYHSSSMLNRMWPLSTVHSYPRSFSGWKRVRSPCSHVPAHENSMPKRWRRFFSSCRVYINTASWGAVFFTRAHVPLAHISLLPRRLFP